MTDVVDCERTPFFFDDNDVVWMKMLRSAAQSEITRFHHHGDFTNDCNEFVGEVASSCINDHVE